MSHLAKKQKVGESSDCFRTPLCSFECVLPDELLDCSIPLVEVYIGSIPDKKLIRNVIVDLNRLIPIAELQHLKRVKKDKVIVALLSEGSEYNILTKLNKLGFNLQLISSELEVVKVASYAPKSRKQFLFSNDLWPTNFHEDKYLESLLSNTVFSEEESKDHEKWMRMAFEAARRSEVRCGTVLVDPVTKSVVAAAGDLRNVHPLKHSVMVGVDLVARSQGGGAWDPHASDFFSECRPHNSGKGSAEGPYLCTGYYAYTVNEPCTMCAMALVHSRIKRVFYAVPSPEGALGTLLKLHTLKNLNHHFEVFKCIFRESVQSLF